MRKLLTVVTTILGMGMLLADAMPPSPAAAAAETQTRRRRRKQVTPEMQMKKFGGFAVAPYDGRYCYVMNAQSRVPAEVFDWAERQFVQVLSLPVRVEKYDASGADSFAPIKAAWSGDRKTGAVVSVIDQPGWTSLLVAPEDGWVQVNVAALAKDNPTPEVLEARTKKELWRAFVLLFGGGNAHLAGDLMRPVNSLKDLDAFPNLAPGPEPFNAVLDGARARGITIIRRTTYKSACEEGWAPAPTNEFQKAIWDQVKADKERGPTNPITIQPPSAKK
jgi:hypothetical protein